MYRDSTAGLCQETTKVIIKELRFMQRALFVSVMVFFFRGEMFLGDQR